MAITLTFLETTGSFSMVTVRFSGALNVTSKLKLAVEFKSFSPLAVNITTNDPSVNICSTELPTVMSVAPSLPSPKSISKELAPSADGVNFTFPELSELTSNNIAKFDGATTESVKSTNLSSCSHPIV